LFDVDENKRHRMNFSFAKMMDVCSKRSSECIPIVYSSSVSLQTGRVNRSQLPSLFERMSHVASTAIFRHSEDGGGAIRWHTFAQT
jgi:hypothetical protein